MASIIINVSELRDVEGKSIDKLAEFLNERIKAKINVGSNEITLKPEDEGEDVPSKRYFRVLLRKFLHKAELKEDLRVISSGENTLTIKIRRKARSE